MVTQFIEPLQQLTKKSMPRILLINDNSEQDNWGAQATPYALKQMLHETIADLHITAFSYSWLLRQFRQLTYRPKVVFERRRYPFLSRISAHKEFFPIIADEFSYAAQRWLNGQGGPMAREFIQAASNADVIVHNGEHSIYRNTLEGCRSLFLLWFAQNHLHKPACEVNHTAHLTGVRPIMSGMVKLVYPSLALVTVREPCSLKNLDDLGITNAHLVPDVAFFISEQDFDEQSVKRWKQQVGLEDRAYFCLSGSALPMESPRPGWEGAVVQLVNQLKRIVPQAVLMAKDRHCQFLKQVADQTDSLFFGPEHSFLEVWPLLRKAKFLVSGHYHYVIMGSMVGCPFIPLSTNSHKMQGVCEHLQWHITTPYDATALHQDTPAIIAAAEQIIDQRTHYSEHLRTRALQLHSEAHKNAEYIHKVLQ